MAAMAYSIKKEKTALILKIDIGRMRRRLGADGEAHVSRWF